MKEMKYTNNYLVIVLDKGNIQGLNYAIVNYGTHPCCYIGLPKNHKFYGKDYDNIDIDCHCGITFAEQDLAFNPIPTTDFWWIGWDYAHCGDYVGYYQGLNNSLEKNSKKWTTEEMLQEVKDVIQQLLNA